jgi:RNA polymerase primary sigma factor
VEVGENRTDRSGDSLQPWPLPIGVDPLEWSRLLDFGRRRGELSTEDIVDVLHEVELTAESIEAVRRGIEAAGIRVDQSFEVDDSGELRRPFLDAAVRSSNERHSGSITSSRRPGDSASQDAVKMYLFEISRIPLLNASDERILGRRITEGIEAEVELAALPEDASTVDRKRLQRVAKKGRQARDDLTQANLRLVVSIAKRYTRTTMPLADAIQSGNIGLMKAVERFDYTKGFKFSTYATWWIKQAISRAVADETRNIRIPTHTMESINRAQRMQRELLQQLQREPTLSELAVAMGESTEKVSSYLSLAAGTTSLDQPTRDDSDLTFADNLAATDVVDPSDSIEVEDMREAVRDILKELSEREQAVMRMRFGLDGREGATLEEVGKAFNITRERVRQIEVRTLFRLRGSASSRALRHFVDG